MDYKIETKEAFTVIGAVRQFNSDTSYEEIPKFFGEHYQSGDGEFIMGMFAICYDHDCESKMFKYMIADKIEGKGQLPDKFIKKEIPAKTWAVFPIKGAMPKALQEVNSKIWSEWIPNNREYEMDDNMNIEMYSDGDVNSPDYYSEIWIPVKRIVGARKMTKLHALGSLNIVDIPEDNRKNVAEIVNPNG